MKLSYLIDHLFSPDLIAFDFVDRYGGMVQTINIEVQNGTDKPPKKRYPVSCDATAKDCFNNGLYQHLIPDDSKKSVVYWEEIQPMRQVGLTKAKDYYNRIMRGTARFVFWANLNNLGSDLCKNGLIDILLECEKLFTKKGKVLSGPFENSNFWVLPAGEVEKDIRKVFGRYDYDDLVQYYLYPNDFFAIDVQFELHQCLNSGGSFVMNPSTDCVNTNH